MKLFIVACIATMAVAFPVEDKAPFELSHTTDVDGSYTFTYSSEDSSKTETRSALGQVRGAYSYIDSEGVLQKIQYVADENGFQVYGSNLPVGSTVPVKETPEVLAATAEHFALIDKHLKKVEQAARLEAKFRAEHPELVVEYHHETPVHEVHVPVHHVIEHHPVHHVFVPTHHVVDEIPVPPMEDEEVMAAREAHLAEVARLTAEHLEAWRTAPRLIEA